MLVAHNAAFDMKFLQLQATGLVFDQPVLDTLLLAIVAQPQQASHRLEALTERCSASPWKAATPRWPTPRPRQSCCCG